MTLSPRKKQPERLFVHSSIGPILILSNYDFAWCFSPTSNDSCCMCNSTHQNAEVLKLTVAAIATYIRHTNEEVNYGKCPRKTENAHRTCHDHHFHHFHGVPSKRTTTTIKDGPRNLHDDAWTNVSYIAWPNHLKLLKYLLMHYNVRHNGIRWQLPHNCCTTHTSIGSISIKFYRRPLIRKFLVWWQENLNSAAVNMHR